jgi:ketosteroid isomerase-like protein
MKPTLTLIAALILAPLASLRAADDARLAVQSADDARIAAMSSPKRDQLAEIFSDDLRYAHSTGGVDTKTSFIDTLTSGKTKYRRFEYLERKFSFSAPDIALMTGRVRIRAATAEGEMENALSFLAVWRKEQGQWRFLAWQSCKIPPNTSTSQHGRN